MRHLPIRLGIAVCLVYLMAAASVIPSVPIRFLNPVSFVAYAAAPAPTGAEAGAEPAHAAIPVALPSPPQPPASHLNPPLSPPNPEPPLLASEPSFITHEPLEPQDTDRSHGGGSTSFTPDRTDSVPRVEVQGADPPGPSATGASLPPENDPASPRVAGQTGPEATDQTPPLPTLGLPLYRLPTEEREVVLTIDDGPSPYTADILAVLAAEEVPAVFFWLTGGGDFPFAGELIAGGHQLGTHTVSHPLLPSLGAEGVARQLSDSKQALEEVSQVGVRLFRPPYGSYDGPTLQMASDLGLSTVLWDVDSRDWALSDRPEEIITNVMQQVRPGSIILIHERKQTLAVLPQLIRLLKEEGYRFRLLPLPVEGKG